MAKFKFEIQNCLQIVINARNKEEARMQIIDNLRDYANQMVNCECYVSDGEEVN